MSGVTSDTKHTFAVNFLQLLNSSVKLASLQQTELLSMPRADPGGGDRGDCPPLKLTKVTLFTIILYNSENNFRDSMRFDCEILLKSPP